MSRRRILSGGIAQESHSFNPIATPRARFTIQAGEEAVARNRGANSTLGGILDAAEDAGVEVVVPVLFRAQSGGPVEDPVFDEASEAMVSAARAGGFDAVVLPLHGGMLTTTSSDPEGALIRSLRDVVGPDVPITAAFDLHAHVTPETLAPLDFLAAYLTNPHQDQAATARRAFAAAMGMLDGRFDPVCASVFLPMLTLGNDRTDEGPLRDLHASAKAAVDAGRVHDVSIFNAQQFLDVPGLGQAVLVYADGDAEAATSLAENLAAALWAQRDAFTGGYPALDACLDRLAKGGARPLVIGDQGDRVAAGGPGDSTFILNALLRRRPDVAAVLPIYAPDAVQRCREAGPGTEIELTFGGRHTTVSPPVTARGRVVSVGSDTPVVYEGPSDKGTRVLIENHAVFAVDDIRIVLTSQPYAYIDPNYFRAVGVDPGRMDLIVTRSGYHFSLNFASVGECVTADTPGLTSYDIGKLPWSIARPFHPLDPVGYAPRRFLRRRTR